MSATIPSSSSVANGSSIDLTSLRKSFTALTRLSSAGPAGSCRARILSVRIGLEELGTMCGIRFAAGRSKYGALGSPWVGGRIHGASFAVLDWRERSALESTAFPVDRVPLSEEICVGSQYFSCSQISSNVLSLRDVPTFFSSAALANRSGRLDGICSWRCLRSRSSLV